MAPRTKAATIPQIHMGNAHRFMLPLPEVSSALFMAAACIQQGTVETYRNRKTGGIMLGVTCPDCDAHHPLIEIHVIDEQLDSNDRFIVQARGCMPYGAYLEASGGALHQVDEEHPQSRQLVCALAGEPVEAEETTVQDVYDEISGMVMELAQGGATLALDLKTGRTALGYECNDCQAVHGIFTVEMPKPKDMRSAAGYTFLGNPFLDMMLEDRGEQRH